jgi:hypothetical protein
VKLQVDLGLADIPEKADMVVKVLGEAVFRVVVEAQFCQYCFRTFAVSWMDHQINVVGLTGQGVAVEPLAQADALEYAARDLCSGEGVYDSV